MASPLLPPELTSRYRPEGILGEGGMGRVVLAHDRELDRDVAVKVALRQLPGEHRRRFLLEARALCEVRHPSVVQVFEAGVTGEALPYLVMEYLRGRTLRGAAPLEAPLRPLLEIADALDAVHAADLVHRDVKGENVLLLEDGRAVLMDFGLVRSLQGPSRTKTGQVVGTLSHMPPEALAGERGGPEADWYGWGVTLFEALEGRAPFEVDQVLAAFHGTPLPELRFERTDGDSRAAAVVRACLAEDPGERPADRAAVLALLEGPKPPTSEVAERTARLPVQAIRSSETGSVAPRRSWALPALAALGLGAIAFAVTTRSGPEPVLYDSERIRQEAASARLDELLPGLIGPLERWQDRPDEPDELRWHPLHEQAFVSAWEDYLRALARWWELALARGGEATPPGTRLHPFGHLLRCLARGREAELRLPSTTDRPESKAEVQAMGKLFLELFREHTREVEALPASGGEVARLRQAYLLVTDAQSRRSDVDVRADVRLLVERVGEAGNLEAAAPWARAFHVLTEARPLEGHLPFSVRAELTTRVLAALRGLEGKAAVRARMLVDSLRAHVLLFRLRHHPGGAEPSSWELRSLLREIRLHRDPEDEWIGRALRGVFVLAKRHSLRLYSNLPPSDDFRGFLEELREQARPSEREISQRRRSSQVIEAFGFSDN